MAKYQPKTRPGTDSVNDYLNTIEPNTKRDDSQQLVDIMERVTGAPAVLWSNSIVGFGTYAYETSSGCAGDWMVTGFAPRKAAISIYIMPGFEDHQALLAKLGPHKTGRSCLYVKRLSDIDLSVLEELVSESVQQMKQKYQTSFS